MNNKIELDLYDLIKLITPPSLIFDKSDIVYHYTPFSSAVSITHGFNNIRNKADFYHRRADCFDDKTEGAEIEKFYLEAIKRLKSDNCISERLIKLLSTIHCNDTFQVYNDTLDEDGNAVTNVVQKSLVPYICCFCKDGDKLEMWNNYLKNESEGFSLGISMCDLKGEENRYFGKGYKHIFLDVMYDDEEKIRFIYNNLKKLTKNECETYSDSKIPYIVTSFLNLNRYRFKNKKYEYEKEVRSVLFVELDDKKFKYTKDKKNIVFKLNHSPIIKMLYYGGPNSIVNQIDGCEYSKFCR